MIKIHPCIFIMLLIFRVAANSAISCILHAKHVTWHRAEHRFQLTTEF